MKFLNTLEFKGALGQALWFLLLITSKFSNYGGVWGRRQWCTMKKHTEDMQNLRAVGGEKFSYKKCINHPNSSNAFCVGFCRRTDAFQVAFPALCLAQGRWWANEWLNEEVKAAWWWSQGLFVCCLHWVPPGGTSSGLLHFVAETTGKGKNDIFFFAALASERMLVTFLVFLFQKLTFMLFFLPVKRMYNNFSNLRKCRSMKRGKW